MTEHRRDTLFAHPLDLVDFRFDAAVVDVFPDMIRRSVPGYETALALGGWIASRHMVPGAKAWDLGCSLLAGSLAMAHQVAHRDYQIIAVDNSSAMLERAADLLQTLPEPLPITLHHGDIEAVEIDAAAAVLMHFTLQFIAPGRRDALLQRVRQGLHPGGVLVVSEKVNDAGPDAAWLADAHRDFKRANGYSDLEIEQKRAALDHIMRPDSEAALCERLAKAGFRQVIPWFRCLNWVSVAALP